MSCAATARRVRRVAVSARVRVIAAIGQPGGGRGRGHSAGVAIVSRASAADMDLFFVLSVVIKVLKLALNIVSLILYRTGNNGDFLGVGGSWNINDEKDPDAEMVASGVLVGFFIYTFSALAASCLGQRRTLTDALLNFVGAFLWVAVGAAALHYWLRYQSEYQYQFVGVSGEKKVGLALGSLCVFNGLGYLLDTGIESYVYFKEM